MSSKSSNKNSNVQMAKYLTNVLSDTFVLAVKTHGYHWNVTGPLFPQLHEFFRTHYEELYVAADTIAERIRAIDIFAPGSMEAFHNHTAIKEAGTKVPNAKEMVSDLLKSHEQARLRMVEAREFAGQIEDEGSEDLMIQRLRVHDETIWMLRSQI